MTSARGQEAIVYCLNSGSDDSLTGCHNAVRSAGYKCLSLAGCEINEDLFACIRSAVFPDFQVSSARIPECSCVVLYKFEGNRTTEVSEPVNECRPLINPVVNKSVENATSCDFENENCDPHSFELKGDKGVANPEGLICENICEVKYTIGPLMGCEKQLTVDRESFRNHTMAKIAGKLNGEKENMCKADVGKGLEDGLAMRFPLSEPREIYKDSLETDNRSNIASEFNFEIFTRKKDLSTIYPS
ncbi:uncharacterized protein TNCV_2119571 [Trichonephila clavipes]|nr:uncharacterized protein TNCV_2119571 [Trichonephila clavipes]